MAGMIFEFKSDLKLLKRVFDAITVFFQELVMPNADHQHRFNSPSVEPKKLPNSLGYFHDRGSEEFLFWRGSLFHPSGYDIPVLAEPLGKLQLCLKKS
jgi:hypothetical protein